ncbi:MAG: hypothetical protein AAF580_04950 [Pseudomonadota bacterium]
MSDSRMRIHNHRRTGLEDAAALIDQRVAGLRAELERDEARGDTTHVVLCSDRAALMEAEHLARLIRSLASAPYDAKAHSPYDVARGRIGHGPKVEGARS